MNQMQYQQWLNKVDSICRSRTGYPWSALCHDVQLPKQAFLDDTTPAEFIAEYLTKHEPFTGYVH